MKAKKLENYTKKNDEGKTYRKKNDEGKTGSVGFIPSTVKIA